MHPEVMNKFAPLHTSYHPQSLQDSSSSRHGSLIPISVGLYHIFSISEINIVFV